MTAVVPNEVVEGVAVVVVVVAVVEEVANDDSGSVWEMSSNVVSSVVGGWLLVEAVPVSGWILPV